MAYAGAEVLVCLALLALAAPQTVDETEAVNYCTICPDHTMCVYKGPGPSTRCRSFSREMTPDERQAALHAHNTLRNRVAAGEERRGRQGAAGQPQPAAANMHKLHWDDELATFARRWAMQCVFDQDACRTSADGAAVSQNVYMQMQGIGSSLPSVVSVAVAVHKWYDEVDEHDSRLSTLPYTYAVPTWHFTMMMWARTTRLGCGFADFAAPSSVPARIIVCNYKEAGNVVGAPMYAGGRPASQCSGAPAAPTDAVVSDTTTPDPADSDTTTAWWMKYPWLPTPLDAIATQAPGRGGKPVRWRGQGPVDTAEAEPGPGPGPGVDQKAPTTADPYVALCP